jgi:glycosyltransferase involved in cell wall biosynthesis
MTADVVGGVWDFALVLASALRRQSGADVTLLALGEPSRDQRSAADAAHVDLRHVPVKLEWMRGAESDVDRTRLMVAEVAHAVSADVIHANHFVAACAPTDIPVVLTLHSDVLSWWRWTLGGQADASEWQSYVALVHAALERAAVVVAVSHFLAGEVAELYTLTRTVRVIHNGWPAVRPEHVQPARPFTFVAGRLWDAAKNVELVVRAAHGWDSGPVFLAGQAHHPESGRSANLADPLHVLGFVPPSRLAVWLQQAAIYLSPARYDPFGLLPLQAALADCALLLSDIPSYRELWDGAACFFRSDDPDDLRRSWSWLMSTATERRELAHRAHARAGSRYTTSSMAEAYLAVYAGARGRVAA